MTWKKNDMITWLVGKREKVVPYFVKAQLLELAKKYKRVQNYVIDDYAKQHGHEVLRLPPYHCELNPIELAWANIKEYARARNTTYKLSDVEKLIHEAIENVSPVMWQNFIRRVTEEEKRFREMDHITDSMLDDGARARVGPRYKPSSIRWRPTEPSARDWFRHKDNPTLCTAYVCNNGKETDVLGGNFQISAVMLARGLYYEATVRHALSLLNNEEVHGRDAIALSPSEAIAEDFEHVGMDH